MQRVLITGVGGATPRSIAKSLRRSHRGQVMLIGTDVNPKATGFFIPGLVDKYYRVPHVNSPDYWGSIERIIRDEKIDVAFVQPEKEVIAWGNFYGQHQRFPCPVLIPPVKLASALMDKSIMAQVLEGTDFIPKTVKVTQTNPKFDEVAGDFGFPCWIRATKGSGGLGSLKLESVDSYKYWLFINRTLEEFTISDFLPGRHLATQMLYFNGEYLKGASLECAEYVMGSIAPSGVTGNTSFGRFLNEDRILEFCDRCVRYLERKLEIKAHGVLSFDLKEDANGNLKVTEVNIRHMAYTGVMAQTGFDLMSDTLRLLASNGPADFERNPFFRFDKPYVFLRDVDMEPIVLDSESMFV